MCAVDRFQACNVRCYQRCIVRALCAAHIGSKPLQLKLSGSKLNLNVRTIERVHIDNVTLCGYRASHIVTLHFQAIKILHRHPSAMESLSRRRRVCCAHPGVQMVGLVLLRDPEAGSAGIGLAP